MDDLLRVLDRKEAKNAEILEQELRALRRRSRSVASKTFRRAIEMCDLPDHRKVIFLNRFVGHVAELEQKRNRTSRLAGFLNSVVSVGAITTPALLSIQALESGQKYIFWTTWSVSLVTGLASGFLSLFKLNARKDVYADVLRRLVSEGTKYLSLTEPYATRHDMNAHDTFFPKFMNAIEGIIMSETRATGNSANGSQPDEEKGEAEEK